MSESHPLTIEQITANRDAAAVALHLLNGDRQAAAVLVAGCGDAERTGILFALADQFGAHLSTVYGPRDAEAYLRFCVGHLAEEEAAAIGREAGGPGEACG